MEDRRKRPAAVMVKQAGYVLKQQICRLSRFSQPGKLKEKGMAYSELCPDAQEGERPVAFYEVGEKMPKGSLLFYSKLGYVKKSDWKEYNILKYAFQAVKVNEGDEIIGIETDDPDPTVTLFFVTANGMCLNACNKINRMPIVDIFKGAAPYVVCNVLVLLAISLWSPLTTWLPTLLGYSLN